MSGVVFGNDLLARTLPKKECTIKMTMYLERIPNASAKSIDLGYPIQCSGTLTCWGRSVTWWTCFMSGVVFGDDFLTRTLQTRVYNEGDQLYMYMYVERGYLMPLQKVSIQVILHSPRRLPWSDILCHWSFFLLVQGLCNRMILSIG